VKIGTVLYLQQGTVCYRYLENITKHSAELSRLGKMSPSTRWSFPSSGKHRRVFGGTFQALENAAEHSAGLSQLAENLPTVSGKLSHIGEIVFIVLFLMLFCLITSAVIIGM
jgi:hypothetical protein